MYVCALYLLSTEYKKSFYLQSEDILGNFNTRFEGGVCQLRHGLKVEVRIGVV